MTHLGTPIHLEITDNATIAKTYDARVSTNDNELSKFRQEAKEIIDLPTHEGRRIKRAPVLRPPRIRVNARSREQRTMG